MMAAELGSPRDSVASWKELWSEGRRFELTPVGSEIRVCTGGLVLSVPALTPLVL